VLHYDGTPITARFITGYIRKVLQPRALEQGKPKLKEAA
jgi:hypothetical protein